MFADPLDPLALDGLLSEEERAIRDAVRRLVDDRVLPGIGDWFERGEFPEEIRAAVADLGLLGMHLDGYGCLGANATSYGVACMELEAGDSGLRSFVSVQGSLSMFPIHRYGSDEQRAEWLPRMATGEVVGCFGLTEPDSGSDPARMRTSARRDGERLDPRRDQDVDHERRHRPARRRVGAGPTTACAASSFPPTRPASPPGTCIASSRCARA